MEDGAEMNGQNSFDQAVIIRHEDTRRAARLALAFAAEDRYAIATVLEDTLLAANLEQDDKAVTGLILGLGRLLGLNVGALDEHTSGAASAGLRQYIAESFRTEESRNSK